MERHPVGFTFKTSLDLKRVLEKANLSAQFTKSWYRIKQLQNGNYCILVENKNNYDLKHMLNIFYNSIREEKEYVVLNLKLIDEVYPDKEKKMSIVDGLLEERRKQKNESNYRNFLFDYVI